MKPFPERTTEHRSARLTASAKCTPEAVETAEGAFLLSVQNNSTLPFGTSPHRFTLSSPCIPAYGVTVHLLARGAQFPITNEITQLLKNIAEVSDEVEQHRIFLCGLLLHPIDNVIKFAYNRLC